MARDLAVKMEAREEMRNWRLRLRRAENRYANIRAGGGFRPAV